MKILIVEDEKRLADSIQTLLDTKGYETTCVYTGGDGLEYAKLGIYDLIILDLMLPEINGIEIAKKLREEKTISKILMLTAKSSVVDRIEGLNAGADYYLTKPFDAGELTACVAALLRRQGEQMDALSFGDLILDLGQNKLICGDEEIVLSAREFDILRLLMQSGKNNLSKERILTRVWGYDSNAVENHVEVYIGFLRKKMKKIHSSVQIVSVRRLGYHLESSND